MIKKAKDIKSGDIIFISGNEAMDRGSDMDDRVFLVKKSERITFANIRPKAWCWGDWLLESVNHKKVMTSYYIEFEVIC